MASPPEGSGHEGDDFGMRVAQLLNAMSWKYFGIMRPLAASAPPTTGAYRAPAQDAADQVALARGLRVEYLTRDAGNHTDMMAFWPDDAAPTHLITCVEGGRELLSDGSGRYNPSVQRIRLSDGQVETILRGMDRCDGIRRTPWQTILVTEETDDGGVYEVLAPLGTTEFTVFARGSDDFRDAAGGPVTGAAAYRGALPTMAWEGLTVLDSGVVIGGDELRPGTGAADNDGGAIFKFVPANPRTSDGPIDNLSESPLASGLVYAMQVSCRDSRQQFGQGCEVGNATWLGVTVASARADANATGATGFYRPEDLHRDPLFHDPDNPSAVRFCWTNTGNEGAANYAEVMCGVDHAPLAAGSGERSVVINRFVEGDTDFNSFDNLAFQPRTGNLYVIEDHPNGDIFACLGDGADRDLKTDGCVKVLSVKDSSAEPSGFLFTADGHTAYLSIQHSADDAMPPLDGYRTDDIVRITGFNVKGRE